MLRLQQSLYPISDGKEGREEGIAIGEERGVLKTARLMKQNGASVEFIKQCTGLSNEEIENL